MLNIQHLTKTYGEKKAVDDLSLHIAPGEIYGFIGHNGAGKTTTLKSVVGILQFDAGEIRIDGKSIREELWPASGSLRTSRITRICTNLCPGSGISTSSPIFSA